MATFSLKARDTRPILEVVLKNPDGSVHDLAGSTAWKLHVRLNGSTVFTRDMTKQGVDAAGTLRYAWVANDWVAGLPVSGGYFKMEYEVTGGTSRLTFPNDSHDVLQITADIANG